VLYILLFIFINNNFYKFNFNLAQDLRSGNGGNLGLHKVVLHETLEVEIGELLVLRLDLEKGTELSIGLDDTTVDLILKRVGADISVDLLADVGAGHLGANGLAEELGKLVADASRLDKARRLAVSRALALLRRALLGGLHLAIHCLLERLVVALEGGEDAEKLLELGAELSHLCANRRLYRRLGINRGSDSDDGGGLNDGSNHLLGGLGLLLGLLLGDGGDNDILDGNGGSGLLITLRSTNHSELILYIMFFF